MIDENKLLEIANEVAKKSYLIKGTTEGCVLLLPYNTIIEVISRLGANLTIPIHISNLDKITTVYGDIPIIIIPEVKE